jgi:signal transduction histidine kinase
MKPARARVHGSPKDVLARCALGFAAAALAILVERALWSSVHLSPFLLVYPAVLIAAAGGGWSAGLTALVVSALALPYWFLPPVDSFAVAARRDALDLAIFCAVSLQMTWLVERMKRALREAHAAKATAEAATAARDTVLAVVAHDLRNPLQTIGLNSELLSRAVAGQGERVEGTVARIHRAAERARRLVDNILDSARIGALPFPIEPTVSPLASLLEESMSPFKAMADARSIELDLPASEALRGTIACDHDRIVQVLTNLVANALHYTPVGGKVVVDVGRLPQGVRFEVRDTGPGMTAEELEHAFDRLVHGKGPGHGSGLGLWIAKALVEAHGGTIEAVSEPGRGTSMVFVLPQPVSDTVAPDDGQPQPGGIPRMSPMPR